MRAIDASSIIHAWDNYPPGQFPPLWRWLSQEIKAKRLVMCEVAFAEVERKFPDPALWLKVQEIERVPMTGEILEAAAQIKAELGIEGDGYQSKGVGENDILIVASAKISGHELITDEHRQSALPENMAKMKIPAVCDLESVSVLHMAFIEMIRESGEVFGD